MADDNDRVSDEALFRLHVLGALRAHVAGGGKASEMIERLAAVEHIDFQGRQRHLSRRTLYRWYRSWMQDELAGLEPAARPHVERSAVLPGPLLEFCEHERDRDRDASIPELIKRARTAGILAADLEIDRTTVWRALTRMGVATSRRTRQAQRDMRRYAYPHRMLMVLADGKHFRAGVQRLRRVALFCLDDASRYGLGVCVGTSESTVLFLRVVFQVLLGHGFMNACYLDHGSGFISDDTVEVFARLEIPLIHGEVAYPEGHGKIERFNRTQLASVLRSFDGNPEIDPEPALLELRLRHALLRGYNDDPHASLGGSTPRQRWLDDQRPLRPVPSRYWLSERFRVRLRRTVTADNTVSYQGIPYEMPLGHAGERVLLRRPVLEPGTVEFSDGEERFRLQPVDVHANAYERRGRRRRSDAEAGDEPPAASVETAADRDYNNRFAPLLDEDGGYPETERRDHDGEKDTDAKDD